MEDEPRIDFDALKAEFNRTRHLCILAELGAIRATRAILRARLTVDRLQECRLLRRQIARENQMPTERTRLRLYEVGE